MASSDNLLDDLDHARASADVLDEKDDLENRVIFRWMAQHTSFWRAHHRYVLVTDPIPVRWQSRAVFIASPADAMRLIGRLSHDTLAMAALRKAAARLNLAVQDSSEVLIAALASALATKRAWLFLDVKRIPNSTKTDPSVYTALNSQYGTKVVFERLSEWEGAQYLRGYVPFDNSGVVSGNSGMTIATGFDIGQKSAGQMNALPIPDALRARLMAFAGKRFKGKTRAQVVAVISTLSAPVPVISSGEANLLDRVIHGEHLESAVASWNARRKAGVPAFADLPAAWQTVLFSRTFHQGKGMPDTTVAKPFYTAATKGDWAAAAKALRDYAVPAAWYKARVAKEAALLATQMPPPVVAPGAAAQQAVQPAGGEAGMMRWAIAVCLIVASLPGHAAGIDCKRATTQPEKRLCSSPDALAADSVMAGAYDAVRRHVPWGTASALAAAQRTWIGKRDANCRDTGCLVAEIRRRSDKLLALAARVTEDGAALPDVDAHWLTGRYQVEDWRPERFNPAAELPPAGAILTFRPGEACQGTDCAVFGLEQQRLTDGPGREQLPTLLGVPPTATYFLVIKDGRPAFGLVSGDETQLIAVTSGCDRKQPQSCTFVRQVWRKLEGGGLQSGSVLK
eukprot:gene1313-1330_t